MLYILACLHPLFYPARVTFFPYTTLFRSSGMTANGSRVTVSEGPSARHTRLTVPQLSSVAAKSSRVRSEEHTSELQSRGHLVCRLLLDKKKGVRHAQFDGLPPQVVIRSAN